MVLPFPSYIATFPDGRDYLIIPVSPNNPTLDTVKRIASIILYGPSLTPSDATLLAKHSLVYGPGGLIQTNEGLHFVLRNALPFGILVRNTSLGKTKYG
jgi:hypothetical protein